MGNESKPYAIPNLVNGQWQNAKPSGKNSNVIEIPDPMNKNNPPIFTIPDTKSDGLEPFVQSLSNVSKTGLHNPLKNVERYLMLGEVSRKVRREIDHVVAMSDFLSKQHWLSIISFKFW